MRKEKLEQLIKQQNVLGTQEKKLRMKRDVLMRMNDNLNEVSNHFHETNRNLIKKHKNLGRKQEILKGRKNRLQADYKKSMFTLNLFKLLSPKYRIKKRELLNEVNKQLKAINEISKQMDGVKDQINAMEAVRGTLKNQVNEIKGQIRSIEKRHQDIIQKISQTNRTINAAKRANPKLFVEPTNGTIKPHAHAPKSLASLEQFKIRACRIAEANNQEGKNSQNNQDKAYNMTTRF